MLLWLTVLFVVLNGCCVLLLFCVGVVPLVVSFVCVVVFVVAICSCFVISCFCSAMLLWLFGAWSCSLLSCVCLCSLLVVVIHSLFATCCLT